MTRLKLSRSGMIRLLLFAAIAVVMFVGVAIVPNGDFIVTKPTLCPATVVAPDLTAPRSDCPIFTEHQWGRPWVYARSLGPALTGPSYDQAQLSVLGDPAPASATGFYALTLAGDLLAALLFSVIVAVPVYIKVRLLS